MTTAPHDSTTSPGDLEEDEHSRRLHEFLLARGIPRHKHSAELSIVLGVDRSTVFRKFKGGSAWSMADLKTVAGHYAISVEALVSGSGGASPVAVPVDSNNMSVFYRLVWP